MPTSVVIAIASSAAATYVGTTLAYGALAGAIAGGLTSAVLGAAFSDSSGDSAGDSPQFAQELRDNMVTVRQPISHWQYIYGRARVAGALTFAHESADDKFHLVITYAAHVSDEIEAIQFNDEIVPLDGDGNATGRYAGYVRIKKSLGDEAGQPFPDLVAESEGKWTDTWRQSGRTKIYVRLTFNADIFPTGLPNITAVIKGRKVYDPRTGLTVWSDNASLCQADFLCDTAAGLGSIYATEIDEPQLIAAANIDDEAVNLAAGGTEARYTLNGTITVNAEPRAPLAKMLTANAGKARYIGGVWRLHPAAYATPTITLSEDDCRAVPHITPRLSASDLANGVKGLYVSEDNFWQSTDFPPITNATYLAEDEGERSWRELDLPFTKSAATAQRIAKIELEKVRQQIGVDWPGKFNAYRLQPGDTVKLDFDLLGWSEKVFEVEQAGLTFEDDDGIRIGCDLVLRETASTVYDWSSGEETIVDPAPDTNLPDPFTVAAPGTPEVAETLFETTGSAGVKARASMSWAAATDSFVLDYLPEYRIAAGTWVVLPATSGLTAEINDIAPGDYEFRVRARNALGVRSAYSGTRAKAILGLTAVPADLTGFTVIKSAGFALASWALTGDLDVRIGGRVVIRHSPLTVGAAWESGIIVEEFNGDAVTGSVPLMTGTYMAKAQDSSGNYSTTAASFVATEGTVTGWTTVATSTQEPAFAGTKTNTAVLDAALRLDSVSTISSMATPVSAWGKISSLGGISGTGSYAFDAAVDLATVATRRFEADIAVSSFDTGDTISLRDLVSTWSSVSGAAIDDCDATLYAATTDDDPAGSPTWSDWMPFFVADFTCRAAKFKIDLASGSVTHNIAISTLAIDIKVPA